MLNSKNIERYYGLILFCLGIVFYLPFLGSVHLFDWDEINFAESSREMMVTGNYFRVMIDFQPFWEKPPLFFWLQVLCMKIFGVNELASRLPNALFGILTLYTIYRTGKRIRNAQFGFIWGFVFFISFLTFFYFKSGIIDPVFNYFIFCSILVFIKAVETKDRKTMGLSFAAGLLNGLAILTKGPVGLLIALLCIGVMLVSSKFKGGIQFKHLLLFLVGAFITSSVWYMPELIMNGPWFLREFITYQIELFTQPVAGHKQPVYYHFVVVLIGCFPLSIFALPELFKLRKDAPLLTYKKWMLSLFWVVMILFTIVSTKIVHYSSMSYLPLSFLAARSILIALEKGKGIENWRIILLGFFGFIFSVALLAIPFFFMNKEIFIPKIKDPFAVASVKQNIEWSMFDYLFGLAFLIGLIVLMFLLVKKQILKGIILYGVISVTVLLTYLKMIVPRIEYCTQGKLIEFYESMQGKNVDVLPIGFKTYANLFYFRQPERMRDNDYQVYAEPFKTGPLTRPVYFVVKNTDKHIRELPDVIFVDNFGGYVVYKREPSVR